MESNKHVSGSSSSFTLDLFGPKEASSSSSTGLFESVFGPQSMGLGRDSPQSGMKGSLRNQDLGSPYGNVKHGTPDSTSQRSKGYESGGMPSKNSTSIYQDETAEPCYYSSSIYYGGREVYPPNSKARSPQHTLKKDGGDNDPNGSNLNGASRGNWWQGSLYY